MEQFTGSPETNWSNSAFVAEALIELYKELDEGSSLRAKYRNAYSAAGEVLDNFEGDDYDEEDEDEEEE